MYSFAGFAIDDADRAGNDPLAVSASRFRSTTASVPGWYRAGAGNARRDFAVRSAEDEVRDSPGGNGARGRDAG